MVEHEGIYVRTHEGKDKSVKEYMYVWIHEDRHECANNEEERQLGINNNAGQS